MNFNLSKAITGAFDSLGLESFLPRGMWDTKPGRTIKPAYVVVEFTGGTVEGRTNNADGTGRHRRIQVGTVQFDVYARGKVNAGLAAEALAKAYEAASEAGTLDPGDDSLIYYFRYVDDFPVMETESGWHWAVLFEAKFSTLFD